MDINDNGTVVTISPNAVTVSVGGNVEVSDIGLSLTITPNEVTVSVASVPVYGMTAGEWMVQNSSLDTGAAWEHLVNPECVGEGEIVERYISAVSVSINRKQNIIKDSKIEYTMLSESKEYKILLDDEDTNIENSNIENNIIKG